MNELETMLQKLKEEGDEKSKDLLTAFIARRQIASMYHELAEIFSTKQGRVMHMLGRHNFAFMMAMRACDLISKACDSPEEMSRFGFTEKEPRQLTFSLGRCRILTLKLDDEGVWHWSFDSITEEPVCWGSGIITRGKSNTVVKNLPLAEALYTVMLRITDKLAINYLGAEYFMLVENDKDRNFYLKAAGYSVD